MDQDIGPYRIDDAVLALLWLGRHDGGWRTWKGFDWDAMDRLHRKGMISDPVGKAKSVGHCQLEAICNELRQLSCAAAAQSARLRVHSGAFTKDNCVGESVRGSS
jgi:hypothetical protein